MKATTHILFALAATLLSTSAVILAGCTDAAPGRQRIDTKGPGSVLTSMGFALTDDGDLGTPAGDLTATFDAPVIAIDDELSEAGTAHVIFDDETRDLDAAAVIDAYAPDNDVVYGVLFDDAEPWRYVIVAAHASALVDGADLDLDGEAAAALVVDEETGSGYLSTSGALHVDTASLVSGGRLAGALSASLVEVSLASWPEALFPFRVDGEPAERAAATGSGTFDATYDATDASQGGFSPGESGSATVSIDVDGHGTFTGGPAWVGAADESTTVLVVESDDGGRSLLAIFVDNGAIAPGATLSLGGTVAGAEMFTEDGATIAFVDGTLTLDDAALTAGAAFRGSFSLSGDAYVIPADQSGYDDGGFDDGEDCAGIDALAATFAPAQVYVEAADGLPAGYDRALMFTDGGNGILELLVAEGVDLHAGAPYAFSSVDFEGRPYPAAVMGLATCSEGIFIDGGVLTATLGDANMTGTLEYSVGGADRSLSFDVAVVQ